MRWLPISIVILFGTCGAVRAQSDPPTEFALDRLAVPATVARSYPASLQSPDQLVRMKESELIALYKSAEPGPIPTGYTPGLAILKPGSFSTVRVSKLISATAWQGKYFPDDGTMINKTFGLKAIKANVYPGISWLDGGPSTIFDYYDRSKIAARYRDEVREVSPGIYLGIMHKRDGACPKLAAWFALDARCGKACVGAER